MLIRRNGESSASERSKQPCKRQVTLPSCRTSHHLTQHCRPAKFTEICDRTLQPGSVFRIQPMLLAPCVGLVGQGALAPALTFRLSRFLAKHGLFCSHYFRLVPSASMRCTSCQRLQVSHLLAFSLNTRCRPRAKLTVQVSMQMKNDVPWIKPPHLSQNSMVAVTVFPRTSPKPSNDFMSNGSSKYTVPEHPLL